jgi:hypothetical protein
VNRKQKVLTLMVLPVIASVFFAVAGCAAEAPRVSKEEVKSLLGNPDILILDARVGSSWSESGRKIKGAIRIDPYNVDSWAASLPKDKKIIIYCS